MAGAKLSFTRVRVTLTVAARVFLLGLFVAQTGPVFAAAVADDGPSVDELLELKAAQGESLEAMDSEIETTISGEDGISKTTRSRMAFDKVEGWMRMQQLDADGKVTMDIKSEGTVVSFMTAEGKWKTLQMDAQTKATVEEMGGDFGSGAEAAPEKAKLRGLGGQGRVPKDKVARKAFKRQRMQAQRQKLKGQGRVERRKDLDQDSSRQALAAVDLTQDLGFEKEGLLSAAVRRPRSGKSRALWQRKFGKSLGKGKGQADPQGHDAVLEMVDEDTGVVMETARFMKVERLKDMVDLDGTGGSLDVSALAEKRGVKSRKGEEGVFQRRKAKLPAWARRMTDSDGVEMVEVQRMKVLKLRRVGDAVVPEETEQVDVTAVGEVKQRVKWKTKGSSEKIFK